MSVESVRLRPAEMNSGTRLTQPEPREQLVRPLMQVAMGLRLCRRVSNLRERTKAQANLRVG